jgi:chromatin segregation and condensation protein Rec8/ScpA/Scc1 (kleisin family)
VLAVHELELDLDTFEGPFDLLLTLVLRDEIELCDIDLAEVVVAFVARLAERDELDLDSCGEFLVLIAALLELKARGLFPDEEVELGELEPEEAAEELARRLAEYRRAREAAVWLAERLEDGRDRFFRLGPAPLAPAPCAYSRSSRPSRRPRTWRSRSLRSRSISSAGAQCCAAAPAPTSTRRWQVSLAPRSLSRSSRCSSCASRTSSSSPRRRRSRR